MKWAKKHLNLTWLISALLPFATIGCSSPILWAITTMLMVVVTLFVLWEKNRNLMWFMFPISVLLLSNKRVKRVS